MTIISVGSVTFGVKARNLLTKKGIKSKLIKTESSKNGNCTYGLKIDTRDFYNAVSVLRENRIGYSLVAQKGNDIF